MGPGPMPQGGRVYADVSPGLALFLGFIPGVGAIYNGQYAKGILHAVIWGLLMTIADSRAMHNAEPLMVITVMAYWGYMCWRRITPRANAGPASRWTSIPAFSICATAATFL